MKRESAEVSKSREFFFFFFLVETVLLSNKY